MHPLVASSAYTLPFWLPMNIQPPTTVGCAHAEVASGKPNAHFNLSRGSSAALRPAETADCSRLFSVVAPQPFQLGPDIRNLEDDSQRPREAPVGSPVRIVPPRYSAIARRSGPLKVAPWIRIEPFASTSRIAAAERCRRTSGAGARESAAPL